MKGVIHYVLNRARSAKRAMEVDDVDAVTVEQLEELQKSFTTKGDHELTTVCLSTEEGDFRMWVGPTGYYRKAQLRRAGVSFPGYPSTERMKNLNEQGT